MTQVEFYSIESTSDDANSASSDDGSAEKSKLPYHHLCEVIKRAYRKGQNVFVHTDSKRLAEKIDEMLWTFDEKSFLPHQLANEDPDTKPPIEIGFGQEPNIHPDVLINLGQQVPQFFSRFKWVFEYAYGDEDNKQLARERFKFYRERGYPLNHRKI